MFTPEKDRRLDEEEVAPETPNLLDLLIKVYSTLNNWQVYASSLEQIRRERQEQFKDILKHSSHPTMTNEEIIHEEHPAQKPSEWISKRADKLANGIFPDGTDPAILNLYCEVRAIKDYLDQFPPTR